MSRLRSRGWCFTINNDTFDDLDRMLEVKCRYLIFGFEKGDKKDTEHIQGYIYFDSARTQESMKKLFPRAHLEVQRGSPDSNYDYCSKEDDFYEFGEFPHQGKCSFDKIVDIMQNPEENFHLYNQYRRSYNEYLRNKPSEHEPILRVVEYDKRYEQAKEYDSVCIHPSEYLGEEVIITHPYAYNDGMMMNWLNGFPPKYKNGYEYATFNPKIIYLTYQDRKDINYINKYYQDYIDHAVST